LRSDTLTFQVFDKIQTVEPGAIVGNKWLGAALALVKRAAGGLCAAPAHESSSIGLVQTKVTLNWVDEAGSGW
jgi:hypothetical protein